jgi:LCP family protein required for cell wall assembly
VQKPKSRKIIPVVIGLLVLLLIVGGGLALYIPTLAGKMVADKVEYENVSVDPVQKIDASIENFLLVGLDVRTEGSDSGRNDLTMVLTLDHKNKKIKLTSIMRDSYVEIPGHNKNRINTAYKFGGPGLAINTVNKLFGLDIQKYVKVDFFGLAKIIDLMGGITVDNLTDAQAEQIRKYSYKASDVKGGDNVKLNGSEAVAYGRIRHTDDDFHRTQRQREVFQMLLDKFYKLDNGDKLSTATKALPSLQTNLKEDEITNLIKDFIAAGYDKKMDQLRIPVDGSYKGEKINGASVLSVDVDKNKEALQQFIYGK